MKKARNFWGGEGLKVAKKATFAYAMVAIKQALKGIVEYDYNAGCCQATRTCEVSGFLVAWRGGKKVFTAAPWATTYVNSCSSVFQDEVDRELLDSQVEELFKLINESAEPVLLHSHRGKILFI